MCKMLLQAITVKEGKLSHASNTSLLFPGCSGTDSSAPGVVVKQEHDLLQGELKLEDPGSSLPSKVSTHCRAFQLPGQGWGRASAWINPVQLHLGDRRHSPGIRAVFARAPFVFEEGRGRV